MPQITYGPQNDAFLRFKLIEFRHSISIKVNYDLNYEIKHEIKAPIQNARVLTIPSNYINYQIY